MIHDKKPKKKKKNQSETLAETSERLYGTKPGNAPFYIDKEGNEFSRLEYMNTFGTSKYTQSAIDEHMNQSSNNKKKRKTKVRK